MTSIGAYYNYESLRGFVMNKYDFNIRDRRIKRLFVSENNRWRHSLHLIIRMKIRKEFGWKLSHT